MPTESSMSYVEEQGERMNENWLKSEHAPRPPRRTALAAAVVVALGAASAADHSAAQDAAIEEVVVTGSRIVRRDLEAASPILTVQSRMCEEARPLAVGSLLNPLPQLVPERAQVNTS